VTEAVLGYMNPPCCEREHTRDVHVYKYMERVPTGIRHLKPFPLTREGNAPRKAGGSAACF